MHGNSARFNHSSIHSGLGPRLPRACIRSASPLSMLVQPSTYGADTRCMVDALLSQPHELRGIIVVDPGISDRELEDMHAVGMRARMPEGTLLVELLAEWVPDEKLRNRVLVENPA